MSYQDLIQKTWTENSLFTVMVELTYRCNLDCFFCYNDVKQAGIPLEKVQYFQLLEDLRDMEVLSLTLTGGEPLAHPDFMAIGRRARELGFVVRIKSNGHALRGRLARKIKSEVDPFVIDLSLHGSCARTHDRQTRVPGSFDRLMENIPELQELGLRLKLNCTVTRWNENEIDGIFAIADGFNIKLGLTPIVSPRDNGDAEPLDISPSIEGTRRLFKSLNARVAANRVKAGVEAPELEERGQGRKIGVQGEKNCGAGASSLTIDPIGNVLPCVEWRRPVGNLHETSIKEIWVSADELGTVRALNAAAKKMVDRHGATGRLMSFCPGMAESLTGDATAEYPSALRQMKVREQLEANLNQANPLLPVLR
jgi:radical SAM protein with 4Fe4S-binding SPASM domain